MNFHRSFNRIITAGFLLFSAVHFFYDPYQVVDEIAVSDAARTIKAGDALKELAVIDSGPDAVYRVSIRARWEEVKAGAPSWKTARVVFEAFDKHGRWIPAPHIICAVTDFGSKRFSEVFFLPERAASARLSLQHRGVSGSMELFSFRLDQIQLKKALPLVFGGLRALWFALAGWTVWHLRLFRRRGGAAVVFIAGLIAIGMLLPDRVVDLMRSAEPPRITVQKPAADDRPEGAALPDDAPIVQAKNIEPETPGLAERIKGAIQKGRNVSAERFEGMNFNFWGHPGLFLLLGLSAGFCFFESRPDLGRMIRGSASGVIYAVAVELLQATELTRTVRISDIGISIAGWLAGLVAVLLFLFFQRFFREKRLPAKA